jgi:aminoglycoside 3-N-acetyltransferase
MDQMKSNWSLADFLSTLEKLEIQSGDTIFIHSNLGMLGLPDKKDNYDKLLKCIIDYIGSSGSIVLPAFTYSFGKSEIFNLESSLGLKEMGHLSLRAFEFGFFRTNDPMFSLLVKGPISSRIQMINGNRSFGPNSVFSFLVDENIRILNICTGAGSTLLHELEFRLGVPYRYEKAFTGQSYSAEKRVNALLSWQSYVRDLDDIDSQADFTLLTSTVKHLDFYKETQLGKGLISSYKIQDMFSFIKKELISKPDFLTKKEFDVHSRTK